MPLQTLLRLQHMRGPKYISSLGTCARTDVEFILKAGQWQRDGTFRGLSNTATAAYSMVKLVSCDMWLCLEARRAMRTIATVGERAVAMLFTCLSFNKHSVKGLRPWHLSAVLTDLGKGMYSEHASYERGRVRTSRV